MNYKTYRKNLVTHMHQLLMFSLGSRDSNVIKKIDQELHRLKNEVAYIDEMTESQQNEQRQTITIIIESRMKFINKSDL